MSKTQNPPPLSPSRPLSPHLQIWGWTATMAASITNRATGIALYAGTILLTAWLAGAAYSDNAFDTVSGLLNSMLGRVVLIGFTWALMFHLVNGIRHLFWDAGHGLSKPTAALTSWLVYALSILLTAAIWFVAVSKMGG